MSKKKSVKIELPEGVELPEARPTVEAAPKAPFIARLAEYTDQDGRMIQHREVIEGTPPDDFMAFIGRGSMMIATPKGPYQHPFVFPIDDATTVLDAFEKMDVSFQKYGPMEERKIKQEIQHVRLEQQKQQQGKIVTAPAGAVPSASSMGGRVLAGAGAKGRRRRRK